MTDTETTTRDETEIRRLVEERVASLRDRDAARLAASYASDMDGSGRAANDLQPETSNG